MFASTLQTTDVVLSTADNKATLCSSETRTLTSALHKSIPIVCCANIAFFQVTGYLGPDSEDMDFACHSITIKGSILRCSVTPSQPKKILSLDQF